MLLHLACSCRLFAESCAVEDRLHFGLPVLPEIHSFRLVLLQDLLGGLLKLQR